MLSDCERWKFGPASHERVRSGELVPSSSQQPATGSEQQAGESELQSVVRALGGDPARIEIVGPAIPADQVDVIEGHREILP